MFTFANKEATAEEGRTSVSVTGAGGNGFGLRCDLLQPQKEYKVRERTARYLLLAYYDIYSL